MARAETGRLQERKTFASTEIRTLDLPTHSVSLSLANLHICKYLIEIKFEIFLSDLFQTT